MRAFNKTIPSLTRLLWSSKQLSIVVRSCSRGFADYVAPDQTPKCTWAAAKCPSESPHTYKPYDPDAPKPKILDNILDFVGSTPMIRLNRIGKNDGLKCELLVKCEFFNAGGSFKDRVVLRMLEEWERAGKLRPGMTLIEPTSGNTGIGLAMAAAVKGYKCIIVMPEKMSKEKADTMKALGAQIVRTPDSAPYDSPESHVGTAHRLQQTIPNSIVLDQYRNLGNPLAHYDGTAEEIIHQCDGKVDMVVIGAGTGGTLTGIGRKIREKCPDCKIIAVDPEGSILANPETDRPSFFEVEGIGKNFVPKVCHRQVADEWIKSPDKESFLMARRLIKEEGLLCGGSSGSAIWAALEKAKNLPKGSRVVVVLADGLRNYMTKFLSDEWMLERGYFNVDKTVTDQLWWWSEPVSKLRLNAPVMVKDTTLVRDALQLMDEEGFDQLPVLDSTGFVGVVTLNDLVSRLLSGKVRQETQVAEVMLKQSKQVDISTPLGPLSLYLDSNHFLILVDEKLKTDNKPKIVGVVSRIDVLNFIMQKEYKDGVIGAGERKFVP